ncbi:MarR family transcriptional regulator [Acuticoccus sp. MNP-M23]|uniref:MarR family winged helix-turn-helix transcriptional regulator n=1 Tax=Acuticoccus sp. MNP-M23 TaxID=3072793 RepID=UPI002814C060|nr:MarR family transcriptional regulator [Acuticoccus sp. MNP-M23]WMS40932.1 MarR family transcriptional regulator [Acuticoccus sp. MNP-M23]
MADPPHFRFLNEVGIIDQLASRLFERVMPDDLTLPQFIVLNHFVRLGGAWSPVRLANAMQVTKATMTNTLHRLETKGYIEVAPDLKDTRAKIVTLTEGGRAARERAIAALAPSLERLARAVPASSIEAALPALAAVRVWLDAERDGPS